MDVVVTGLFTLLGAFGGVWLTQRYASGEAHEARVEARRDAQRRVVAELLIAGRSKVERYMVLLPFAKKFTDQDWIDYLETDSGRELGRVNAELQRSLAQARLLIGDASMSSNVERLLLLNNEFSDAVMGSAQGRHRHGLCASWKVVRGLERHRGVSGCVVANDC